jgi:hypothetical protein
MSAFRMGGAGGGNCSAAIASNFAVAQACFRGPERIAVVILPHQAWLARCRPVRITFDRLLPPRALLGSSEPRPVEPTRVGGRTAGRCEPPGWTLYAFGPCLSRSANTPPNTTNAGPTKLMTMPYQDG